VSFLSIYDVSFGCERPFWHILGVDDIALVVFGGEMDSKLFLTCAICEAFGHEMAKKFFSFLTLGMAQ
jgi:hypothetical protein